MQRVYLDQNKWIDLARASYGRAGGERFIPALAVCRAARAAGAASFPLDMYRYWETAKQADVGKRHRLADFMFELSAGHTMSTPFAILDQEIDEALQRRFPKAPIVVRQAEVFGHGVAHISNGRVVMPAIDWSDPRFSKVPSAERARITAETNEFMERELLRAGPEKHGLHGRALSESDHAERHVAHEESVSAEIVATGATGRTVDVAVRAKDLADILPAVHGALSRIGLPPQRFAELLRAAGLLQFMDDLPTRYVTNVMRSAKHRQREQRWEPNDFIDIVALPLAAVYCDVVVTEKQWVHRLRQGGIEKRFGTTLLTKVEDLVEVLHTDS